MSNRKQLKGVKKNRHKSKSGNRRRGKCKKSVVKKCRLRLLAQDTLLNKYYFEQEQAKVFEAEGLK